MQVTMQPPLSSFLYCLSVLPISGLTAKDIKPTPFPTHGDFSVSYNRFNHAMPAGLLTLSLFQNYWKQVSVLGPSYPSFLISNDNSCHLFGSLTSSLPPS